MNGPALRLVGSAVLVLAGVLSASCSRSAGSPRDTLTQIRAAAASSDGATFYDVLERETRAHLRDQMRGWKARLERGDADPEFVTRLPLPPDVIRSGELEPLVIRWLGESSPLTRHRDWLDGAAVVGEARRTDAEEGLLLRGADGTERTMWFIREDGRWALDFLQTSWLHQR